MGTGGRLGYLPAVDGLRAVAVAAVIAFHLSPDLLPGGFLGVDTFFVVSGYLITSLLVAEHAADGTIALRSFWIRRARRLLPALLLVLLAVAAGVAAWWPAEDLARVRGDALAGLGYVANWRFVASGESYFDLAAGPSPLRHLWSLAIEEQFYVVWPLVAVACLRRRRGAAVLGAVSVLGAVASVVALVLVGAGDRAYYGTDTRAHALLVGAALAVWLRPHSHRPAAQRPAAPRWLAPAGAVALAACAASWWVAGETSEWLYRWGFPAYALATAVVVASVVRSHDAVLARVLATRPLVAVGKLSYGLYLWHWPAIVLLTEQRTGLDGPALAAFRLAVTVVGAGLSYVLIERPVRFGTLLRGRIAAVATGGALTGTAAVVVLATAGAAPTPDYLRAPTDGGAPIAAVAVAEPVPATVGDPSTTTTAPAPHLPRTPTRVLLVGDSVAWTFADELGVALGERGVAYASSTIVGCGAAVGVDQSVGVVARDDGQPHPWSYDCTDAVVRVQAEGLAAVTPDLVLFHSTWETADRLVGDRWVRFGSRSWDAVVRRELRDAVDRLTAGGARVAVLTVPPTVDGELQPALARDNERRAHYDELLREVVADDSERLLLVDLAEIVCGGRPWSGRCPTEVDGIRLRPLDGNHFEDEGAAWVAARLADAVVALDLDEPASAAAPGEGAAAGAAIGARGRVTLR